MLTVAIIESIAVLLHKHDKAMKDDEDGMRPWPAPMDRPAYGGSKI